MADDRGSDAAGYLGWFFLGAIAGAAAAALLTPKTGRETRELLFDPCHALARRRQLFAVGSAVGDFVLRRLGEELRLHLPITMVGADGVRHDGEHPGMQGPLRVVVAGRAMDAEKNLLKEIVAVAVGDAATDEIGVNGSAVARDELAESLAVPLAVSHEQVRLGLSSAVVRKGAHAQGLVS